MENFSMGFNPKTPYVATPLSLGGKEIKPSTGLNTEKNRRKTERQGNYCINRELTVHDPNGKHHPN